MFHSSDPSDWLLALFIFWTPLPTYYPWQDCPPVKKHLSKRKHDTQEHHSAEKAENYNRSHHYFHSMTGSVSHKQLNFGQSRLFIQKTGNYRTYLYSTSFRFQYHSFPASDIPHYHDCYYWQQRDCFFQKIFDFHYHSYFSKHFLFLYSPLMMWLLLMVPTPAPMLLSWQWMCTLLNDCLF